MDYLNFHELIVMRLYRGAEGVIQDNVKNMYLILFSYVLNSLLKHNGILSKLFKHMSKKFNQITGTSSDTTVEVIESEGHHDKVVEPYISYCEPTSPHHGWIDNVTPSILNQRARYAIEDAIAMEQFKYSKELSSVNTQIQRGMRREIRLLTIAVIVLCTSFVYDHMAARSSLVGAGYQFSFTVSGSIDREEGALQLPLLDNTEHFLYIAEDESSIETDSVNLKEVEQHNNAVNKFQLVTVVKQFRKILTGLVARLRRAWCKLKHGGIFRRRSHQKHTSPTDPALSECSF